MLQENKFAEEVQNRANIEIDTVLMSENYEFIAGIVGEEDMNALNMAIKGRFYYIVNNEFVFAIDY